MAVEIRNFSKGIEIEFSGKCEMAQMA